MMKETILSLMLWISSHSNLQMSTNVPDIVLKEKQELHRIMFDCHKKNRKEKFCENGSGSENLLAVYDNDTKTIYISKDIDRNSIVYQSVILHELVHHLQFENKMEDKVLCRNKLEEQAYRLQNKWLQDEHDTSLVEAVNMNMLYLFFITRCRDEFGG